MTYNPLPSWAAMGIGAGVAVMAECVGIDAFSARWFAFLLVGNALMVLMRIDAK